MLRFRPATAEDARELAGRLRAADRAEIQAAVGLDAALVLAEGVALSRPCWAVADEDGSLLALFGVIPADGDSGRVWLLGSDELAGHWRAGLRHSRGWGEEVDGGHDRPLEYIDGPDELHIPWVR